MTIDDILANDDLAWTAVRNMMAVDPDTVPVVNGMRDQRGYAWTLIAWWFRRLIIPML